MSKWYLLQFKPNSHRTAERNLCRQGFKTFLPMLEMTSRDRLKFTNSLKPLFPGYMFVNVELNTDPWRKINSTIGVSRLLYNDGKPQALPNELILGLRSRCDSSGLLMTFKAPVEGDSVRILKGAFADFIATVETIDNNKRIWVMMELMGRRIKTQVEPDHIQNINAVS